MGSSRALNLQTHKILQSYVKILKMTAKCTKRLHVAALYVYILLNRMNDFFIWRFLRDIQRDITIKVRHNACKLMLIGSES